jgi:hypothetical protein
MPTPEVLKVGPDSYSYDFKREFSGWPVLTVSGRAGAVVRMTPAELNDWKDGRANARAATSGGPGGQRPSTLGTPWRTLVDPL